MDAGHASRQYASLNSNHVPSAFPTEPQAPTKKRRTSTTGSSSRGVANLTPEQLAKKRANDREAQRAIRERTKGQIEKLEKQIQELTSQQPYQELQHAIRQKEAVEADNKEIKARLASALSLLQPLVGPNALLDSTSVPHPDGLLPPPIITSGLGLGSQASGYGDLRSATSSTYTTSPHTDHTPPPLPQHASYTSQPNAFASANPLEQRSRSHTIRSHTSDEKLDLGYLINSQSNGRNGREQHPDGRMAGQSGLSMLPMHTLSPYQNARDGLSNTIQAYAVPVRNVRATCPLDGLLLDFLADRRQHAEKGASTTELIGPAYPSMVTLIDHQRGLTSHPLSKVFTDMLSKFPDISTLPEQVAVLYIMFLIMRWQISPTEETYSRLPSWVTPRPSQLFTPHPAWIDHLPWPLMRDKLVQVFHMIPFDEFFIPYTTTISLNWPYEPMDTLLTIQGSDELGINPVFERHLRDLGNWSLGPAFAKAHPILAETVRIRPEMERRRAEGGYM